MSDDGSGPEKEEARMDQNKGQGRKPLPEGQEVWDSTTSMEGVVIDHAKQYSHPQAAPVYIYMIRWKDGQVGSVSEAAFRHGGGLSLKKGSD